MPNITLSLPEKFYKFMKEHKEVIWTEIVRRSLWDHVYKMQRIKKLYLNMIVQKKRMILNNRT